jgi:hypothetical protein
MMATTATVTDKAALCTAEMLSSLAIFVPSMYPYFG